MAVVEQHIAVSRHRIRRRDLIAVLGGAAVAWPLGARAQQPAMPVVGFINDQFPERSVQLVAAFRKGLSEQGFVEGRNLTIEFRWARGDYNRVPELVVDLIARKVAVIATEGTDVTLREAKAATSTIPIIGLFGGDPVKRGFVASFNRPGGNVTGIALFTGSSNVLDAKRLDFLLTLVPGTRIIGILVGTHAPISDAELSTVQTAAEARGLVVKVVRISRESDFDPAFASLAGEKVDALVESPNAFFTSHREQLVALATSHRIPAIWERTQFVEAGGLMSYGTSLVDAAHQQGVYAGRILRGEKPGDLPVMLPTTFRLAVNTKTAKALGLTIPPTLLAIADEVIE